MFTYAARQVVRIRQQEHSNSGTQLRIFVWLVLTAVSLPQESGKAAENCEKFGVGDFIF